MIAIVSHDSGGAEILSSWVLLQSEPYCLVLSGPAIGIFHRKLGDCKILSLEIALDKSDWMLSGTSWQSDIELKAIKQFKEAGKKTIAFLDHWKNYYERFIIDGFLVLPDIIWVGDTYAEKIARDIFPTHLVILQKNPYLEAVEFEFNQKMQPNKTKNGSKILYVCEPISESALRQYGDEHYWGYTEDEALEYFLQNLPSLDLKIDKIIIRPHPSEKKNKYDSVRQNHDFNIHIGGVDSLLKEISQADILVGCDSMAMVVGLIAKKRVLSCVPPGGRKCSLPHDGIEHIHFLSAANSDLKDG